MSQSRQQLSLQESGNIAKITRLTCVAHQIRMVLLTLSNGIFVNHLDSITES